MYSFNPGPGGEKLPHILLHAGRSDCRGARGSEPWESWGVHFPFQSTAVVVLLLLLHDARCESDTQLWFRCCRAAASRARAGTTPKTTARSARRCISSSQSLNVWTSSSCWPPYYTWGTSALKVIRDDKRKKRKKKVQFSGWREKTSKKTEFIFLCLL